MYSKKDLINAIDNEVRIIKHLVSKIQEEYYEHRLTQNQRTIKELTAYLAISPFTQIQYIFNGDANLFIAIKEKSEKYDIKNFDSTIDQNREQAKELIINADDSILDEEITLFGRMQARRGVHLVDFVRSQISAYKMQLFLQMKHGGLDQLVTSNLWSGVDPELKL